MGMRELAMAVTGELHGKDVQFTNVSTDTRTLQRGELFVALQGPTFDGHDFVGDVEELAAGLITNHLLDTPIPQVTVKDTRWALGRLSAYWRGKFSCPLIAVTGSNGKTTVKEMIGAILGKANEVLVSPGNLNNDIGVPLVLSRLRGQHAFAVIEMGMNHLGEIDYLTKLARPQVAVITNAAAAHLEGLSSVAAVARAKAEIFNGLEAGGTAVINADDQYKSFWQQLASQYRILTFGLAGDADIRASDLVSDHRGTRFTLNIPDGEYKLTLNLPGKHNVLNALAATAAAIAVGIDIDQVRNGLQSMVPIMGRLAAHDGKGGATIIDDSYNANPASMMAAIDVLSPARQSLLVMGDMGELGTSAIDFHEQIGLYAQQAGIDQLFALGVLSETTVNAFGNGARHFASQDALVSVLLPLLTPDLTVLVKGSRYMRMEKLVAALVAEGWS